MCCRVLLFTDSDVFAGTERHIIALAVALRSAGATAVIGCPTGSALEAQAVAIGLPVMPIEKMGTVDWRAVRKVVAALRSGEIQIIHAHNGRTLLIGALATWWAGCGGLVATQHFLEPTRSGRHGMKGVLSAWAHQWIARRADRFVAISMAVRARMLARGDCSDEKIVVIPNGIVPPDAARSGATRDIRAELRIRKDVPLVVCASRLQSEKNIPGLVEAIAKVRKAIPDAVCIIAGQGDQERAVRATIAELGMEDAVQLLGFRSDVLDVVAAGDLFVLPSFAEPFGLVLLEAMALGKAVVSTAAGGPLEIVQDGVTGLLVPPGDAEALGGAIAELLSDPERRERMGKAGRERFLQHYTADRMARQMIAVYEDVIRGNAADRSQELSKTVANAARSI